MLHILFIFLLECTQLSNADTASLPLFFIDHSILKTYDAHLKLTVHTPIRGPRVIKPDKPWESWAVFAYNHVMEVPLEFRGNDPITSSPYRLYYDCIEGNGQPPGKVSSNNSNNSNNNNNNNYGIKSYGSISRRRICLAISKDGLVWTKPNLNIFNRNSTTGHGWSKQNNILLEDSGVSVFIDRSPNAIKHRTQWKMITSLGAYQSGDGLYWYKLPFAPVASDDTKPTAYWDHSLQKYVISVRRDLAGAAGAPNCIRTIGRCVTTNLSNWQSEIKPNATGCPVVFQNDAHDPISIDLYTNAWTPYPSDEKPSIHLFFPSMYFHFNEINPYGFDNDGLLDIRLLVSRDGQTLNYVKTNDQDDVGYRSPFVHLGINQCGNDASSPDVKGGWCSPVSGIESTTSFDTSAMYMASGHLLSLDSTSIYLYSSGQPFSHGGYSGDSTFTWKNNSGIRVLTLRKDGFVSIDAPYIFKGIDNTMYPTFTTENVVVPSRASLNCLKNESMSVIVNFISSVTGFVVIGIEQNGEAVKGYSLNDGNRLKGNAIQAKASWDVFKIYSIDLFAGQEIAFRVAMADASLYSLDIQCV